MISAKIIADSVSPAGIRITTLQLQYPRFVHSEFMTHRVFSRNAASSRAIPIQKMIEQVEREPAMPVSWGKNQSGMQAREELDEFSRNWAIAEWYAARDSAVRHVKKMVEIGVHKQIANRLLEPFQEIQTIVTATEWENFYNLRCHPDAQPEIKVLAEKMREAMDNSVPAVLSVGDWHLPYVSVTDKTAAKMGNGATLLDLKKWSTARCARVSYLTHDKKEPDIAKDTELHDRLLSSGHFSPFEHQATPDDGDETFCANFRGWRSYRFDLGC